MSVRDPVAGADVALRRSLVTPEGVDLNLRIADAGQRIGAFAIDVILQHLILTLFVIACGLAMAALKFRNVDHVAVVMFLGAFLLRNAWFIGFELSPRGATPGKRMLGLRVAARDGGRLTAEAVITRNALREVEFFLPISFIFAAGGAKGFESGLYLMLVLWTGIFLGLGASAKLYPLFILGPLLVLCVRDRRWPALLRAVIGTAGAWLVANLPVMLLNFQGWKEFYTFSQTRGIDFGSIWLAWSNFGHPFIDSSTANTASAALFLVGCLAVAVLAWFCPAARLAQLVEQILAGQVVRALRREMEVGDDDVIGRRSALDHAARGFRPA